MASKILVIQTAFLGDLLLSIPLLKNTRRLFPDSKIYLLCRKGFGEFFESLELVDSAIEIDKSNKTSMNEAIKLMKCHEYELVISTHQSLRSAFYAKNVKAKMRIGFSKWWNAPFFSVRIERPMDLPDALRQLALLRTLDKKINTFFSASQIAV